jgi:uncharacterized membrane protein YphA (DoxX/SURF4 family)
MSATTAAEFPGRSLTMPAWKTMAGHVAAALIAILFLASGPWKILDPIVWSKNLEEFLVPTWLSTPGTLALAVGETLAGVLILIPRFRRWGAWLASLLLVAFMAWMGWHYTTLVGKDCSCFPIVKRTVGPMFFIGDAVMLLLAILAGIWARPSRGLRGALAILAAIAVFAGVSYGVALSHQTGTKAPDSITVDGQPYSLQHGRIFLFFYDPNCSHCDAAARTMAKFHWKDGVTIIGIPTTMPRFAAAFVRETGINARTSLDLDVLKKVFPFGDPPYGVALDNGREIGPVPHYDGPEPADTLRKLGFIE